LAGNAVAWPGRGGARDGAPRRASLAPRHIRLTDPFAPERSQPQRRAALTSRQHPLAGARQWRAPNRTTTRRRHAPARHRRGRFVLPPSSSNLPHHEKRNGKAPGAGARGVRGDSGA
jgi:hypothetical protein